MKPGVMLLDQTSWRSKLPNTKEVFMSTADAESNVGAVLKPLHWQVPQHMMLCCHKEGS